MRLMFGWKHGRPGSGGDSGRLSDKEYQEMLGDLRAIRDAVSPPLPSLQRTGGNSPITASESATEESPSLEANVPLRRSGNERIRALVDLPQQGTLDDSHMRPAAAQYRRTRPFLTAEQCQKWGIFYLPPGARSTLRGRWTYTVRSVKGDELCFVGRDPEYEQKRQEWTRLGRPDGDWAFRRSRYRGAPAKVRFPKEEQFRKRLELYGQQLSRLQEPWATVSLARYGLLLLEGFNDVVRLDDAEVLAVGLMGRTLSDPQLHNVIRWSAELAGGKVTVWGDNDSEGLSGMQEVVSKLAAHTPVLQAWSKASHGGRFAGKEPEQLTHEELRCVLDSVEERWQRVTG
ncbi:MAG: hypothetical protein H8E37_09095 [Planctomycetes bacterium]|nr:hypothetical protein [Planctomycetota bacterium]